MQALFPACAGDCICILLSLLPKETTGHYRNSALVFEMAVKSLLLSIKSLGGHQLVEDWKIILRNNFHFLIEIGVMNNAEIIFVHIDWKLVDCALS